MMLGGAELQDREKDGSLVALGRRKQEACHSPDSGQEGKPSGSFCRKISIGLYPECQSTYSFPQSLAVRLGPAFMLDLVLVWPRVTLLPLCKLLWGILRAGGLDVPDLP